MSEAAVEEAAPSGAAVEEMEVDAFEEADEGEEAGEEEGEEEEEDEDLPELSLDIFDVIKSAQAQHGLRHGDHARYRQYCSRRLHRLRKGLKFTHGKGRYVKRPLEQKAVRDSRHLMLPLFCAERAWSFAMQIKRENTQQEPRPHFHLLSRLAKAAQWSAKLAALCAKRGDQRTELEANAYAAFMSGNMHLEREHWGPALSAFKRCATISSELCRVSMAEQVHLYRQMVAEVEPSVRFCAYNLRRLNGEVEGAEEATLGVEVEGLAGDEATSDILRSKLEHVLQETRAKQAKDLNEIELLGERIPIKSDKTRVCILQSRQLLIELANETGETASEQQMGLYDKLFVAFNDALESVRADLRATSKEHSAKAGVAEGHLQKLQVYLQWQKLHHTVRRTLLLVERHRGGSGKKRSSPEDLVRLYDSIIATLAEMSQLEHYKEDEQLMGQVAARTACAKAYRCYYVGESYGAVEKWREAQALYARAAVLMGDGVQLLDEYADVDEGESKAALEALDRLIEGAKARATAHAVLVALDGSEAVTEASRDMTKMGLTQTAVANVPLLQRLDHFAAADPDNLIAFPPTLETVPCKPLLFDIARNQIQFPDLSSRLKSSKRSTWGSWFSRG